MRALAAAVLLCAVTALAGAPTGPARAQDQPMVPAPHNGWHFVRGGEGAVAPAPVAKVQRDGRTAYDTAYTPYATVAGIVLHHPSQVVERIGFHQSNHEGARDVEVADTAAAPMELESRGRLTGPRSAADVVVGPEAAIRAPATGVVLRAGTYVLYCDHSDDFVVIAPDAQPAWEVKILHIDGVQVAAGDRVRAGVTQIAPRATVLPFRSQVDRHTAEPSWPHVHLEVVDPSIENVPNGGSGSSC